MILLRKREIILTEWKQRSIADSVAVSYTHLSVDMTEDEDTKDRDYDYRNGVPSGEKARASCNTQVTLNNLGTYDETYDEDATATVSYTHL